MTTEFDYEKLTHEELETGWRKFIGSVCKRIRKRTGQAELSPKQMEQIAKAFSTFRPNGGN